MHRHASCVAYDFDPTEWSTEGRFRERYQRCVAQEQLIDGASIPYTVVRATQFFEFVKRIADEASDRDVVRLPHVLFQPIAADDVLYWHADAF